MVVLVLSLPLALFNSSLGVSILGVSPFYLNNGARLTAPPVAFARHKALMTVLLSFVGFT